MPNKSTVHIAAGVLYNEQGQYLLSSRPTGKSKAGYWEFAGGKIEAGETPFAALQREFQEELGIHIHHADRWLTRLHRYPEKNIQLQLFRIPANAWQGEPQGRENQKLLWQNPQASPEVRILPSNRPVIRALRIPRHLAGSLEHGFCGDNGYRVCPIDQACAEHPVLLPHDQRLPEAHSSGTWHIVHNREQYRATSHTDAWVWHINSPDSLAQLNKTLREGTPQPLIICADAATIAQHQQTWQQHGAHAIVQQAT